jgi:hypothetical protein
MCGVYRFNTPQTCKVELEVLGHKLSLAQDPNSQHHGTTIWDSSIVFVKYLVTSAYFTALLSMKCSHFQCTMCALCTFLKCYTMFDDLIYVQSAVKDSSSMFGKSFIFFLLMGAFENLSWASAGEKQQEGGVQQS